MRTSRLTTILERTLDAKAAQAADPGSTATVPRFDPERGTTTAGRGRGARRTGEGDRLAPVPDGSRDRSRNLSVDQMRDPMGHLDDLDVGDLPTARRSRSTRGRHRLLVPAAACVAVALALAGVVVLQNGNGAGDADLAVRPLELGDPPDGWLVPTWVPDGMELWGMDTYTYEPEDRGGPATIPQLFGDPGGGRAIYVVPNGYEIRPATRDDVAVRGTTGSAGTGWGVAEENLGDAVSWKERGLTITALYRGVSQDQAIAVLDALEWRTDDPLDGFAPPADGTWPLRAEAMSRATVARGTDLRYSEDIPDTSGSGIGLAVTTSSSNEISEGYLESWYLEASGNGTGPLMTTSDERELSAYWPDGRSVTVSTTSWEGPGSSVSLEVLERVATSMTVASTTDLTALRSAVESRIEALPLVATADTAIGAVEVRTEQTFVRLCLRGPGSAEADCDTSPLSGGASEDGSALVTAQWIVNGAWYVTVASRGDVPQVFDGATNELPAGTTETTEASDWTVQLVQPPPDVAVCVGSDDAMSCISQRPE